jgi:hypothetical protein
MSAGPCDTGCGSLRITAGSHGDATVVPMSSHPLAGPPPTLDLEKRAGRDGTAVRGGTVFHNSAITMQVSGSVGAFHQVLPISTPNDLRVVVEHPRRTASTLNAHARAQRATGDSTMSLHCSTPRLVHREWFTGQPFQGGARGEESKQMGQRRFDSSIGPS